MTWGGSHYGVFRTTKFLLIHSRAETEALGEETGQSPIFKPQTTEIVVRRKPEAQPKLGLR